MQGAWKNQLRRKFKNMRRPASKRSASELDDKENQEEPVTKKTRTSDDGDHTGDRDDGDHTGDSDDGTGQIDDKEVHKLQTELSKDKPSGKAVRKIMKKTFEMRREWICHHMPGVSEVLEKFPPLKRSKFVS